MITDMTYLELDLIKSDIDMFINKLNEISSQLDHKLTKEDEKFFIFISKHIIFFKYLYRDMDKMYFFKVLISDLYYYILSILKNETRYMYLNERSIIENYTRAVIRTTVEEDHITANVFLELKKIEFSFDFKEGDYSLIKNEYITSCGYVHGGIVLNDSLSLNLDECFENNKFTKKINKYYIRIMKIFKTYDKMLISEYAECISGCFHRQKTVLKYLLGDDCLELLYGITHNNNINENYPIKI